MGRYVGSYIVVRIGFEIINSCPKQQEGVFATGVAQWPEITWEKVSKIGYRSHCFGAEESYKATLRGNLRRWSYPSMGRAVCDIDCEHRLTVARKKATDILLSVENEGYAV